MKLAIWLTLTVYLLSLSGQVGPVRAPEGETLPLQRVNGNFARCPVCKEPVDSVKPLTLLVSGDRDTAAELSLPVLICPKDGVVFAVRP